MGGAPAVFEENVMAPFGGQRYDFGKACRSEALDGLR
jgi:hypothetical protein